MAVACYCRVSTGDQSLDRQREETWEYALAKLDAKPAEIEIITDKSTGTDTDRPGFDEMMARVRDDEFSDIVVLELSRLTRSMRDLLSIADDLEPTGTSLHVMGQGLSINMDDPGPFDRAFLQLLGVFAELEANMIRQRVKSGIRSAKEAGKWTGRPPYGFGTDSEGYLVMNGNFDRAMTILDELDRDESIRSLARRFGVGRATVRRIRDREDFYRERAVSE